MKVLQLPQPYYEVPPCPKCGSRRTGRYMRKPVMPADERYVIEQCLTHGELVKLVPKVPIKNAFCEECGCEWEQKIWVSMVSRERVGEEISARRTMEAYSRYIEENPKRKKTIFGKIFGFLP